MSLKNWSTTAASNNSAPPNGAPESTTYHADVNDILRQNMADTRTIMSRDTIAAAATTDIGSKDATHLTLTGGVVTITALGTVSDGIYKFVYFNAAHTVTHHATSLQLRGGVSRTYVAGDISMFESLGSGNWREVFYAPVTSSSFQPADAQLDTLAAITAQQATDLAALSTFMGTVLNDANAGTARTTLGAAADASTQTFYVPAGAMKSRTTNGAASGTVETTTNKIMLSTLDFDTATDEHAQFSVRMPKGWDEGTVTATPVWSHAATTVNFGVAWFIQAVAFSNDDALDAAFGTAVSSVDTGGTTDDIYVAPATAAMTIAGTPQAEDYVVFQIYRDVSDAGDTLAIDARLHGVTINYTTTSLNDA